MRYSNAPLLGVITFRLVFITFDSALMTHSWLNVVGFLFVENSFSSWRLYSFQLDLFIASFGSSLTSVRDLIP